MAKTMTQLNKTNQEQLEAEKKKVISITIQASNNKVKEKRKRVVQKGKNIEEPIKKISKETKKSSKNIIVAPRKELMKKKIKCERDGRRGRGSGEQQQSKG